MKKIILFVIGAIVGVVVSFVLFYSMGSVLEGQGILLYDFETDQQRNFNIFMVTSLVFAIIGGWVSVKKFA